MSLTTLPVELVEIICDDLSKGDIIRLSQVSKSCRHLVIHKTEQWLGTVAAVDRLIASGKRVKDLEIQDELTKWSPWKGDSQEMIARLMALRGGCESLRMNTDLWTAPLIFETFNVPMHLTIGADPYWEGGVLTVPETLRSLEIFDKEDEGLYGELKIIVPTTSQLTSLSIKVKENISIQPMTIPVKLKKLEMGGWRYPDVFLPLAYRDFLLRQVDKSSLESLMLATDFASSTFDALVGFNKLKHLTVSADRSVPQMLMFLSRLDLESLTVYSLHLSNVPHLHNENLRALYLLDGPPLDKETVQGLNQAHPQLQSLSIKISRDVGPYLPILGGFNLRELNLLIFASWHDIHNACPCGAKSEMFGQLHKQCHMSALDVAMATEIYATVFPPWRYCKLATSIHVYTDEEEQVTVDLIEFLGRELVMSGIMLEQLHVSRPASEVRWIDSYERAALLELWPGLDLMPEPANPLKKPKACWRLTSSVGITSLKLDAFSISRA